LAPGKIDNQRQWVAKAALDPGVRLKAREAVSIEKGFSGLPIFHATNRDTF